MKLMNKEEVLALKNEMDLEKFAVMTFQAPTLNPVSDMQRDLSNTAENTTFHTFLDEVKALPTSASLFEYCTPVKNQGNEGLCTRFAAAAVVETKYAKLTGKKLDLSERYYWVLSPKYNAWDAAQTACKYWGISEGAWPYSNLTAGNPGWESTKCVALKDPREVKTLDEVKEYLAKGEPLIMSVSGDFSQWGQAYIPHDKGENNINGAHAIIVVGYETGNFPGGGYLVFKNSWSPNWGNNGYGFLPFAYITQGKFWTNFIAFSSDMYIKDAPIPAPDDRVDLKVKVTEVGGYTVGRTRYVKYDWEIVGNGVDKIEAVEEKIDRPGSWVFPRFAKQDNSVIYRAKTLFATYATNWQPGILTVTLKDGRKLDLPFIIP